MKFTEKIKIIVYTINIGGYDELNPAPKDRKNTRYIYFTDGDKAPDGWELIKIPTGGRRESRELKINSHFLPNHDISIYIDACYKIKKPLSELIFFLGDRDIALPEHGRDKCVYRHAERVIKLGLCSSPTVRGQMNRYKAKGMKRDLGLSENCIIIRKNTLAVSRLNEIWWTEYMKGSQRDQLSLPYAIWKTAISVAWLPFSARKNRWVKNWSTHLKDRIIEK